MTTTYNVGDVVIGPDDMHNRYTVTAIAEHGGDYPNEFGDQTVVELDGNAVIEASRLDRHYVVSLTRDERRKVTQSLNRQANRNNARQ